MNRISTFEDYISNFSPHLSQTSIQKTAHAAQIVEECIATFDVHSFSNFLKQEHAITFLRELPHTTRIAIAIFAVKSGGVATGPNSLSG